MQICSAAGTLEPPVGIVLKELNDDGMIVIRRKLPQNSWNLMIHNEIIHILMNL